MFRHTNTFQLFEHHTMNMAIDKPASTMEGHSNPTIPLFGISTPSGGRSSQRNFVNHPSVTLEANKQMMDALQGYPKATLICEFSQKAMLVHPSQASSSHSSPLPFSLFNECELRVVSECHWDTNQKEKVKKDTNTANDNRIKGPWTPEEDRYVISSSLFLSFSLAFFFFFFFFFFVITKIELVIIIVFFSNKNYLVTDFYVICIDFIS